MKSTYSVNKASAEPGAAVETGVRSNVDESPKPEAGRFRTIFPQILASSAKNLLLVDLGLAVAFPTIVIPVLRGLQTERNPDETLHFTAEQATWYGSVAYISQPIGSALSGWISEPIGRRKAMMLVNIPHIIAWTMLYFAQSSEEVFVAAVLLGLGVGFMEAPIITYVGEITQPSIRGILIACAGVAAMLGFFIVYLLGTLTLWRNVALICLSVPLMTVVAIYFIPETPLWLLSKKRDAEALQSLQWLRGWVSPQAVQHEFGQIKRYSENSNCCVACQKADIRCGHPPADMRERVRELMRKRTLRPFVLIITCFSITQFSGMMSIRPYMVQIFEAYGVPIDPNLTTVGVGLIGLLANIVCMCVVKVIGKRKLYFFSLTGAALSCFSLCFYAQHTLPAGWSSFDKHVKNEQFGTDGYYAMMMFFSLAFFTSVGLTPIPWMLLSEVFPFKSRGVATGITAALNYVITFVSVKTYLNVETTLSISGSMLFYGCVNVIGLIFTYIYLPETEGRTLEEIELFFSDNKRPMYDRKIQRDNAPSALELRMGGEKSFDRLAIISDGQIHNRNGCDNKAFDEAHHKESGSL